MGRISLMVTPPPQVTGSYVDRQPARRRPGGLPGPRWPSSALPVLCLTIVAAAPIVKQTRAIAIDVLACRLHSLRPRLRAAGSGADPPHGPPQQPACRSSPSSAPSSTGLVGTSSLIELVFAWGGAGQYGLTAILQGDFTAVQGYVLFVALFSLLVFVVVDALVFLLEPRATA